LLTQYKIPTFSCLQLDYQ